MATSPADTSGTVGETILDVTSIIEHAVRRCGVSAASITGEQQQSARDNLFLILSNLATRGLSLWCVAKLTMGLVSGRLEYSLPVGTIDVLNAFQRNATGVQASAVGAGLALLVATEDLDVSSVIVTPLTAGRYHLVLESSPDNASWITVGTANVVFADNVPIGLDATRILPNLYWRVRDTLDASRLFNGATFFHSAVDTPMSKMNRDMYSALPNKHQRSGNPTQFWYDKQFYRPQVSIWPGPRNDGAMRLYTQRHIQDPGAYTNAVEIPQRWHDAVISLLAPRVCLELPTKLVPPDRYDKLVLVSRETLADAENSETDGAPIVLAPNISHYTR